MSPTTIKHSAKLLLLCIFLAGCVKEPFDYDVRATAGKAYAIVEFNYTPEQLLIPNIPGWTFTQPASVIKKGAYVASAVYTSGTASVIVRIKTPASVNYEETLLSKGYKKRSSGVLYYSEKGREYLTWRSGAFAVAILSTEQGADVGAILEQYLLKYPVT